MTKLIVYNHGIRSKPIVKVISIDRVNGDLVIVWRKKVGSIKKAAANLLWFVILLGLPITLYWWLS